VVALDPVTRSSVPPLLASEPADAERLRLREPPSELPFIRQVWRGLGFLHWRVDPSAIAALLPTGLEVDTFGGAAYVGIVPFTIPVSQLAGVRFPIAPSFHELNLRTYVHRAGSDPGVWFFSLDAASRLAVWGARFGYSLPYFHARMSMRSRRDHDGLSIDYRSRRNGGDDAPGAEFRARYGPRGPAAPASPGSLEFFLVERYLLYSRIGDALASARVHHAPYPIQAASASDVAETLTSAAGLPRTIGPPDHVCYASEVDVRIFPSRRLDNPPRVR